MGHAAVPFRFQHTVPAGRVLLSMQRGCAARPGRPGTYFRPCISLQFQASPLKASACQQVVLHLLQIHAGIQGLPAGTLQRWAQGQDAGRSSAGGGG